MLHHFLNVHIYLSLSFNFVHVIAHSVSQLNVAGGFPRQAPDESFC